MSADALTAQLSGIEALVLDVDDTIIDTHAAMLAAGTAAAAELWPDHAHHAGMADRFYRDPNRWFRRYAAGELAFARMRWERLADVAREFGQAEPDDAALARFEQAYAPAFASSQRLFPQVPGLVCAARERGLRLGLLTNSAAEPTRVKLEALELTDTFDAVVTRDSLGFGKPDPRVYAHVCTLLGVGAARAVCVGDSLEWDVLGALDAGMRAIWLDVGDGVHNVGLRAPDHVVSVTSLQQITGVLQRPDPS